MKKVKLTLLLLTTLVTSCVSFADPILLVVDASEMKDSKVTSAKLCDDVNDCSSWETYFIYKAKIKDVLYGSLPSGETDLIIIANSQHAGYVNKGFNDWMILIQKIEDSKLAQKLGAGYMVKQASFPEKYYCFDGKPDDLIDKQFITKMISSDDDYYCYSLNDLPEGEL